MKNKGIYNFILCIGFIVIGLLVNHHNRTSISTDTKSAKFQAEFLRKEQLLNELFAAFTKTPIANTTDMVNFCEAHKIDKNNFIFFVYREKALAAWSSNEIIPPLQSHTTSPTLLQMDNKWVYIKQTTIAKTQYIGCLVVIDAENTDGSAINDPFTTNENRQRTYTIHNQANETLFTLSYPEPLKKDSILVFLELLAWLLALTAFLFAAISFLLKSKVFQRNKDLLFLLVTALLFAFSKLVLGYMDTSPDLFSPLYYSTFFSSLGALFANTYLILLASIFFMQFFELKRFESYSIRTKTCIVVFFLLLVLIYFIAVHRIILGVTNDSVVMLRPEMIYQYDLLSIIAIFSIVFILWSVFIVVYKALWEAFYLLQNTKRYLWTLILSVATYFLLYMLLLADEVDAGIFYLFFLLLCGVISLHIIRKKKTQDSLFYCIIYMILSGMTLFTANQTVDDREKKHKESTAEMMLSMEDPFTFYLFNELAEDLSKDAHLATLFTKTPFSVIAVQHYIISKYLQKYTDDYRICIDAGLSSTWVTKLKREQFHSHDHTANRYITDKNSSFRRMGFGRLEYTVHTAVPLPAPSVDTGSLVLIFRKHISVGQNFELEKTLQKEMSNYCYAGYENNILKMNAGSGNIRYPYNLSDYHLDSLYSGMEFRTGNILHTVFIHENTTLLVSSEKQIIWDKLAFVIILFLAQFAFSVIPMLLFHLFRSPKSLWRFGFEDSIQFFVSILIAFTVITTAVFFSRFLNITKAHDQINYYNHLSQRINKIINTTIADMDSVTKLSDEVLQEINAKLVHLYDADFLNLNLYDENGENIESYGQGMYVNAYLDPVAYKSLSFNKTETFSTEERYGSEKYRSFYQSILNKKGNIIGYMNLFSATHYPKKAFDYRHIQFFTQFMSLCILIIILIVISSMLLIRYLTRPLKKVTERLSKIKLGEELTEIEWNKDDEFGHLVNTYNMLIVRLQTSADLLEKSSQEIAWKDMAKQIAHEIKNPLTPMRLTTQQLLRELQSKHELNEEKLNHYFDMIIQQTDTLSDIASSFSNFAKENQEGGAPENLIPIIQNTVSSYDERMVSFVLINNTQEEEVLSFVNKSQISRVFNNLIKNAIQASKSDERQKISIEIENYGGKMWLLKVTDTGIGMTDEVKGKIFSPNFTTKTSGMGLGLAIVQRIIRTWGGSISFKSTYNIGTTFFIFLPKYIPLQD